MPRDQLLVKTGDTSFDAIWAHYKDPKKYKLSEKQQELNKRWLAAFTFRMKFKSRVQTVNAMMKQFKISRALAFIDLKNSERLFGDVMKAERQGSLAVLYEYAHNFYLKSRDAGDLKSMGKALELMGKYSEIDREVSLTFNPDKLENKQVKLSVSKTVQQMVINQLEKGTVDFNKIIDADAEIIEDDEQ